MAILQNFQPASQFSFRDVSKVLFKTFTNTVSETVHIIFDDYRYESMKNAVRNRRGISATHGVQYKNILPSYSVKSWKSIMASSNNKVEIVKFLVSDWKKEEFTDDLFGKTLFVTEEHLCWRISKNEGILISELENNQEEADTRILLHTNYATGPVIIHADDTDIILNYCQSLPECHIKIGKGKKTRIIDIYSVKNTANQNYHPEFCEGLLGLQAFSGCDTVSSFSGKEKTKVINLILKYPEFIPSFVELGQNWSVTEGLIDNLIVFVCAL